LWCIDGAPEGGTASVLGSTPWYFRLKYMPLRLVMDNIEKGYIGRNIYILSTGRQPSRPLTASR
jgi:hypothetical protein